MRRGGISSAVKNLLYFILAAGVLLAILYLFGNNPFELLAWCIRSIWNAIVAVANALLGVPGFKETFR